MKRFFAWVLLLGFVLLLVNIMVFQYFIIPSIAVYLVVAVFFLFFMNKPLPSKKQKSNNLDRGENETINQDPTLYANGNVNGDYSHNAGLDENCQCDEDCQCEDNCDCDNDGCDCGGDSCDSGDSGSSDNN